MPNRRGVDAAAPPAPANLPIHMGDSATCRRSCADMRRAAEPRRAFRPPRRAPALRTSPAYEFRPERGPPSSDVASRTIFDAHAIRTRLSHPAGAGARPPARVARQRRDDAEAAGRHRPRLAIYYEHENSNIHRAAHTLAARATDAYEARARQACARFSTRRRRRTSSSSAARPRASTSSRRAGAGATSARATRSSSRGSSTTPTSSLGSMLCSREGRAAARRAGGRPRAGHPRGVRAAPRAEDAHRVASPTSRTRSGRSRRRAR